MISRGNFIVYQNGNSFELGQIKCRNNTNDGWFVWYSSGDTAANTPDRCIHELKNGGLAAVAEMVQKVGMRDYLE